MKEKFVDEVGHHFIMLSDLGKGAFGKVYECINIHTHKTVALKVMRKYKLTQKQLSFAEQEARILQKLNHPNIVKLYALYHTQSFLIIEMEYLKEKSLSHLLSQKRLTEEEASVIMRGIFQAVHYLHKSHVIHRDLKPDNIIFASKDPNSLKIADFGLSTEFEMGQKLESQVGTLIYMAPELLTARRYTETADIWSCGIILYNLLCGKHPLYVPGDNYLTFTRKLEVINWSIPSGVSTLAKDLFMRCVKLNPIERYSAGLAINHPWVTRVEGKIPITHIEEIRIHQDRLKMKVICLAALCLASLNKARKNIGNVSLRIQPNGKIGKIGNTRSQGKLLSLDTPIKINRKHSEAKLCPDGASVMSNKSPRGLLSKVLENGSRRTLHNKIKLSPLPVKYQPKSADR